MASDGEADDARTLLHRSTRRSIRQEPASVFAPFQKLSEDLGLTTCVDRSAKGVSAINNATAMLSDRQMVRTYKSLLGTVGNSARKMVVDPQMPHWLNNSVGSTFDSIWPEIEKEMCDRFILQNGFSFGDYRRKFAAHEAEVVAEMGSCASAMRKKAMVVAAKGPKRETGLVSSSEGGSWKMSSPMNSPCRNRSSSRAPHG